MSRTFAVVIAIVAGCAVTRATEGQRDALDEAMDSARKAYVKHDLAAAETKYLDAIEIIKNSPNVDKRALTVLQQLALVYRLNNKIDDALKMQDQAVSMARDLIGADSLEYANAEIEFALTLRAQKQYKEAMEHVQKAAPIRAGRLGRDGIETARDLAMMGMLARDMELLEFAKTLYKQALDVTERNVGADDPRVLPYLDILGRLYRDDRKYADAEPYYTRALVIREATYGPDDAELISTLDGLSYVLYGQERYEEAEPIYKRLLKIWEDSADPEHPMVALTCDKIQEFYSSQKKYEEAEKYAMRALLIRNKAHTQSLLRIGRIHLGLNEVPECEKFYKRAVVVAEDPSVPEDMPLPAMMSVRDLLKQLKRTQEAAALDARIKPILLRKGDREGRRPVPGAPKPVPADAKPLVPGAAATSAQ